MEWYILDITRLNSQIHHLLSTYEGAEFLAPPAPYNTTNCFILTMLLILATILAYLVMQWGEEENRRLSRKQPGEFDNDV